MDRPDFQFLIRPATFSALEDITERLKLDHSVTVEVRYGTDPAADGVEGLPCHSRPRKYPEPAPQANAEPVEINSKPGVSGPGDVLDRARELRGRIIESLEALEAPSSNAERYAVSAYYVMNHMRNTVTPWTAADQETRRVYRAATRAARDAASSTPERVLPAWEAVETARALLREGLRAESLEALEALPGGRRDPRVDAAARAFFDAVSRSNESWGSVPVSTRDLYRAAARAALGIAP
jgi:hypothetical protein